MCLLSYKNQITEVSLFLKLKGHSFIVVVEILSWCCNVLHSNCVSFAPCSKEFFFQLLPSGVATANHLPPSRPTPLPPVL